MSLYHPTLGEQWWLNRIANGDVPKHWGHPDHDDGGQEPGRPAVVVGPAGLPVALVDRGPLQPVAT